MKEADIWKAFRGWFPGFAQRLEISTPKGVPDVHWLYVLPNGERLSGWIELKLVEQRATGVCLPTLKLEQVCWLNQYAKESGRCCILAVLPSATERRYFVLRGNYRDAFKKPIPSQMVVWSGSALDNAAFQALTET